MRYIYFCFLFLLMSSRFFAQDKALEKVQVKYKDYYYITEPNQNIVLDTVMLFPKPKFKTNYDRRYYRWFQKKTFHAYPYAVLAKNKLAVLNDSIDKIDSKRKRKKFIKQKQNYFKEQFADNIKNLTRTEGRILIKLIHRLTGKTVNIHLQEKKGKFKAFLYRTSAKVFKIKLDLEYHPESLMEDYIIESILQEAFSDGFLEEEPSVLKSATMLFPRREIHIEKKK